MISRECTVILVIFLFNSRFKSSDPRTHRQPDSQVTPYLSRAAGQATRSSIGSRRVRKGDLVDVIQVISLGAVDADGGGGASISNTTVPTLWNIFCRCYKPYSTSSV